MVGLPERLLHDEADEREVDGRADRVIKKIEPCREEAGPRMHRAADVRVVSAGRGQVLGQFGQRHAEAEHDDEGDGECQRSGLHRVLGDQLQREDKSGPRRDVGDRLHDHRGQLQRTGPQIWLRMAHRKQGPLRRERGQVHVFGRRFLRQTRSHAEKWTSPHPGRERLRVSLTIP